MSTENIDVFTATVLNELKITAKWNQSKLQDSIQSKLYNLYKIF